MLTSMHPIQHGKVGSSNLLQMICLQLGYSVYPTRNIESSIGFPTIARSVGLPTKDFAFLVLNLHTNRWCFPLLASAFFERRLTCGLSNQLSRSVAGVAGVPPPDPKISEALLSSCDFQVVI